MTPTLQAAALTPLLRLRCAGRGCIPLSAGVRFGGGGIEILILLALVGWPLLHAAVQSEPRARLPAPLPLPPPGSYAVLVADWGLHSAIVVEQPPGWRLGPPGAEAAPFLEIAWGDRRYYAAGDRRPQAVAAALFLPTEAALFLAGHPDPPLLKGAVRVHERRVDAPTLHALLTSLERSLPRRPAGGRPDPLPLPAGRTARFLPAHGAYLWTRNCNWWTLQRLSDAGLAAPPLGVLFSRQVPAHLQGFQQR